MFGYILLILLLLVAIKLLFGTTVYWFYRPGCPHCSNMKDEWQRFENMCLFTMVNPSRINLDNNSSRSMANKYNVNSVPTIIRLNGLSGYSTYNGPRTAESIYSWVCQ